MKKHFPKRRFGSLIAWLLLLILSITVLAPLASNPDTYKGLTDKLDEKQKLVMEVTGVATAGSIGLAAIPDDSTTPVANKIMDLAGYLVIVLCVIVLEKYLLTILGYAVFTWMIPIACAFACVNLFLRRRIFSRMVIKIMALSIIMVAVIPISIQISDLIEKNYSISIDTSDIADNDVLETAAAIEETQPVETEAETETESAKEGGNWFNRVLNGIGDTLKNAQDTSKEMINAATEAVESAASSVTRLTDEAIEKAKNMFWDLVETVVVLIVTNCVIPILVLAFLLWAVKLIVSVDIGALFEKEPDRCE